MTTITKYVCDLCGKVFEGKDECQQHEILEKISKYSNDVVFFGWDKRVLSLDDIFSSECEICGIYVENEDAISSIEEFFDFSEIIISPWSIDGGNNRKTTGLYLYDEDAYCWYLPADKIEELKKEMKEYGVDA